MFLQSYIIKGEQDMKKSQLKPGIISELTFVNTFGTPSQKEKYKKEGRFIGTSKQTVLKEANRWGVIKDLGERKYEIEKVYNYPIPKPFTKMNKSIYKYICPLLLNELINGYDENNKITLTTAKWARQIHMVNANYNLLKYNRSKTSDSLNIDLSIVNDFCNRLDDMIREYIINALDYLQKSGLIVWNEVYVVRRENVDDKNITVTQDDCIHTNLILDMHPASAEEKAIYSKCMKIADAKANINSNAERYYSKKAKLYSQVLKEELSKENIKSVYKGYEVYYTNLKKCKEVLNQFKSLSQKTLIEDFNNEFTNMLVSNAQVRFNKNPQKYLPCKNKNDYSNYFSELCTIVINNNAEYFGDRIAGSAIQDKYTLKLDLQKKDLTRLLRVIKRNKLEL